MSRSADREISKNVLEEILYNSLGWQPSRLIIKQQHMLNFEIKMAHETQRPEQVHHALHALDAPVHSFIHSFFLFVHSSNSSFIYINSLTHLFDH